MPGVQTHDPSAGFVLPLSQRGGELLRTSGPGGVVVRRKFSSTTDGGVDERIDHDDGEEPE
jgi:hypothetical protein